MLHSLISISFYFYRWGGEDDDWTLRMFNNKLCIIRPVTSNNAPFAMLKHTQAAENNNRYEMLGTALERQYIDGYSNIDEYAKVNLVTRYPLFTHILIDVKPT